MTPSFRDLAERLGLGMAYRMQVSADGAGREFTFVGDSCQALTGIEADAALADASLLYGQIYPDDLRMLQAAEATSIAQRLRFEQEVRARAPDGGHRWWRIVSAPTILADGSTVWDGLLTDVTEVRRAAAEVQEQRRRLEAAVEATGLGLWDWDVRSGALVWSDRNRELFGLAPGEPIDIGRYQELVHPDDRDSLRQIYQETAEKRDGGEFVIEHRTVFQPEGRARWLQARGRVVKDGDGVMRVVGATLDISARKASEERRALLMGELAHRAKNGILVMMAIVAQTARSAGSVKEFEDVLTARLQAMADSQDLVTASGGRPVQLADVVARTLTPFDASRFDIDESLSDVIIAGELAVSLGLLLHELSTNAVKYGALSKPGGRVAIRRGAGKAGQTVIAWAERGGPAVDVGKRKGFGSRLLEIALRTQGGKVEPRFDPTGFQADIHFPVAPAPRGPTSASA